MSGRSALLAGLLLSSALGVLPSETRAEPNGTAPCAGVVLKPTLSEAASAESLREAHGILLVRVLAAHESEALESSLFVSLDRDRFVLDAPGMTCAEARQLAESRIVRETAVEIGLAGEAPRFDAGDLEPRVDAAAGQIRLQLRPEAVERFRSLTRRNVGGTIVVRIDAGSPIELPIRTEQVSGVILLDRSEVPAGAFVADTLLPLPLEVDHCGRCLGEYR